MSVEAKDLLPIGVSELKKKITGDRSHAITTAPVIFFLLSLVEKNLSGSSNSEIRTLKNTGAWISGSWPLLSTA